MRDIPPDAAGANPWNSDLRDSPPAAAPLLALQAVPAKGSPPGDYTRIVRGGFLLRASVSVGILFFTMGLKKVGAISADIGPVVVITLVNTLANIPYLYLYNHYGRRVAQVTVYVVMDIAFITLTAHYLGGIDAFYAIYGYVIVIVFASFFLSRKVALGTTLLASSCYLLLLCLEARGRIPHHPSIIDLHALPGWLKAVITLFNISVMFTICGLSAVLSRKMEEKNISLARASAEIEDKNRMLEVKIRERTAELERKNRELEDSLLNLHETRERLSIKESMSELGKFVADAAHAIKTPVGVIRILLEALKKKAAAGERVEGDIDRISGQISELREFIDNLLNFYGPGAVSLRKINLNNLLEISLSLIVQKRGAEDRVRILRDYGEDLPLLEGDFYQLQHAFMNILSNAFESMPHGGEVSLRTRLEEGHLVAQVADTGCAMSAEEIRNIFRPFYTTKQGQQGVGLGLAIAKKVIERHRGYIQVESRLETGSRFVVGIPVCREAAPSGSLSGEGVV